MNKHQNGFSIIEALLILIIVGLLGFTGWYVWHSKQVADKTLSADNSSSPTFNKKTDTTGSNPPATQSTKYLVIKEWGIKLPLSNAISDAYYVVSTNSKGSDGQPNTMWLGLKSLDGKGCKASQANSGGAYPIGAILKVSPDYKDPVSGESIKQSDPDGVMIGNYYYAYHSGIAGSSATRCIAKANISNANEIDSAFKTAAKSMQSN